MRHFNARPRKRAPESTCALGHVRPMRPYLFSDRPLRNLANAVNLVIADASTDPEAMKFLLELMTALAGGSAARTPAPQPESPFRDRSVEPHLIAPDADIW